MSFTWIPYYKEFSQKLLQFRNNRKNLLEIIYKHRNELCADYLHDEGGYNDLMEDIDPFTTLGIFNRGINVQKRIKITTVFKELLDIDAPIPHDFDGVPILNNQKSHFVGYKKRRNDNDIENLWTLFEKIVKHENFETEYNQVIEQFIININITMGLFWMCPEDFLAFDSKNRKYLKEKYDINIPTKVLKYQEYISILNDIKGKMKADIIEEKSFCEISANSFSIKTDTDTKTSRYDVVVERWKRSKNIVLYGAPGTGKTYDVPEYAVRLCDPNFHANSKSREEIMNRYNQLKQEKRIAFTTFHQSMDYEDWIEGLRPVVNDNNQVTYTIENGSFKQLCEYAERPIIKDKHAGISNNAVVWKVSLMGTGNNPIRTDCMANNYIRIGWDDYGAVISDETNWDKHNGEGKIILDAFINKMKVGDIIMSCYSNRTIDAIGVVTGDYEYRDNLPNYKRVRTVNWILKDINENIVDINDGKTMTLSTVYRLHSITLDKVKSILDKYMKPTTLEDNNLPYVMVIDEMNRGNVSKIFGELITLLETDKRKGCRNAESVILPYSKKPFTIPSNVYLIATMNTADRSLGSLDYAIRRRFSFIASKPYSLEYQVNGFNAEIFKQVSQLFISNYDEYEASEWNQSFKLIAADTLSEEYRPEDVWIGHSYFIMTDENNNDNTCDRLLYEIIPLLEEYVRDGVLTSDAQKTIDNLYKIAAE